MTAELQAWLEVALVVLGRVSAFLAALPFVSAARVPMPVRAYLAISLSVALTPLLYDSVYPRVEKLSEVELLGVVGAEIVVGLFFGFLVRVFFLAVSFVAEFISQQLGFMGMFAPSITEGELLSPFADLVLLLTAALFFLSDLHLMLIQGLVSSYDIVAVAKLPDLESAGNLLSSRMSTVFQWSLQLSAPFVLYVTVCNFLLGLANRLVPQVPIQFVMAPAILAGGLGLALLVLTMAVERLIARFSAGGFGL